MTTLYKGKLAPSDSKLWDGATGTFSRNTDTGGSETLNRMAWNGVDVLEVFGNKTNRTRASIASALGRIGTSNKVQIWLSPGTWTIDDDLTITANVSLCLPPGALLSVSSGKTLTINGNMTTGLYQTFTGSGSVVFGDGSIPCVFPEWWGIDGTADDAEITKAVAAAANIKRVQLQPSTYYIDNAIAVGQSNIVLCGLAMHQTILSVINSCSMTGATTGVIDLGSISKLTIENLTINGNKDNNGSGTYHAIYGEDTSWLDIHDCTMKEFPTDAVKLAGTSDNSTYDIYNNYFTENDGRDVYIKNSSLGRIANNVFLETGGIPIYLDNDAEYTRIINNNLWNMNDAEDDDVMTAIWIGSDTASKTVNHIQIMGNTITDDDTTQKTDYGITLDTTNATMSNIQILNNDFDVSTLGVYYIDTNYSDVMVSDNQGHTPLTESLSAQTTITLKTGSTLTDRWEVETDGDLMPAADSSYDIGSDSVRPANIYGDNLYGALESYDTGWIARSDWTNVHMGTDDTKDADSDVTHNLAANISELLVKVLVSTDGSDTNSFELYDSSNTEAAATGSHGLTIYQVNSNSFTVQTGTTGAGVITQSDGTINVLDADDWYYKIKVWKLG